MSTQITIVGNTTSAAELRFIPSGKGVASFTVAVTERKFDKNANEWRDGDTTFYPCSAWGPMAENVAESLTDKGMRVIVQGRLKSRSYDDREGNKRTVFEVDVEEVGPSLAWATAVVTRATTGGGGKPAPRQPAGRPQPTDPWATSTEDAPF